MKDYNNPQNRQQFLQKAVNRNLLIQRLAAIKSDAETKALKAESELIEALINVISRGDRMSRSGLLRKLNMGSAY